jgi:putative Holliday junction resolvase
MKYLGIDYGTKRIGVAQSDESGTIAFPLTVVEAGPEALGKVATLAKENRVEKIVIGESRNLQGKSNPVMEDIELFKKDLAELAGLEVVYQPEFFTTAQAARVGQDKRGEGGGEKSDASAAALILQGYLDKMGSHERN